MWLFPSYINIQIKNPKSKIRPDGYRDPKSKQPVIRKTVIARITNNQVIEYANIQ